MKIDLQDRLPLADHFYFHEFLKLHTWDIHCFPDKEQYLNLIKIGQRLERIRTLFGDNPIIITSGLRPSLYNRVINGAKGSAHITGEAVDFVVSGYMEPDGCNKVRSILSPKLEELKIRMEDKPDSNWAHIDIRKPGPSGRYFKP